MPSKARRELRRLPDSRDEFVVGCGLDFDEKYRNLDDICILEEGGIGRGVAAAAVAKIPPPPSRQISAIM